MNKDNEIRDCTTCSINDSDVCRSCVAKAARVGEYPLYEKGVRNE